MHLEAIKSEQQKIFKELYRFKDFYLVGGTALALQLGHRVSVDFDLFTDKNLPTGLLKQAERIFKWQKVFVVFKHPEQLSVVVNGVKIDFVKEQPLLLKPVIFQKVEIAQINEIMAMKARTLGFRGKFKDYIDLYFVLKNKITDLNTIGDLAKKKYETEFNFRLFLEQLSYLKDVQEVEIEFLQERITKAEVQKFFEQEILKLKL